MTYMFANLKNPLIEAIFDDSRKSFLDKFPAPWSIPNESRNSGGYGGNHLPAFLFITPFDSHFFTASNNNESETRERKGEKFCRCKSKKDIIPSKNIKKMFKVSIAPFFLRFPSKKPANETR